MTGDPVILAMCEAAYIVGGTRVLDRVNLRIGVGECVAVVGRNGSGKSTLARLAAAQNQPADGEVRVFDVDASGLDMAAQRRLRGRIGMVLQGGSLLSELSIEDNLLLGLGDQRAASLRRQKVKIDRALLDFGLENIGARIADGLSSGERRRVELARAFLRDPDLLILDDPFDGVDETAADELVGHIQRLIRRRPRAVLLLTQSQGLAEKLSSIRFDLERGRLFQQSDEVSAPAARS